MPGNIRDNLIQLTTVQYLPMKRIALSIIGFMINNSIDVNDLRIPPANRLEKLSGNLKDYHSIRINNQWRIIFIWNSGTAFEVEITDYHK